MFKLLSTLVIAATAVHGIAIPRDVAVPSTYNTAILEPYADYNTRYNLLDCADQHDTDFFDECCHPLLLTQSLSDRPAECTPASSTTTTPASTIAVVNAAASPVVTAAATGIDAVTHTGKATWFYQNGVAGACGTVHAETDKVIALDTALYGATGVSSEYCGKTLLITNKSNGKTVTATVADACPTCESSDSIDLSQGAFEALADLSVGEFDVSWHFTD